MQQLNAQDAQFLYMESENNLTHVTGVSIFDPSTAPDGVVRFKDIISHVEGRLHTSPLFRRKLVRVPFELDYPYWVEDKYFDIEYHIRHGRLPEPGDWRQFCIHLARYHSRPLDMGRPLWEMYVIEGLGRIAGLPKGSYAIATKIHHATIDGASAMKFFAALNDIDAQGTPAIALESHDTELASEPAFPEMIARAMVNNIKSPVRMADTLFRAAPALYDTARKAVQSDSRDKTTVPDTRFNVPVSPHKVFDATHYPLATLKQIKSCVPGATINDVVLTICGGALRRYLMTHSELPRNPLVAWVPINARSGAPGDADEPGNNISAMTAPIATDISDALKRLEKIRGTTKKSKEAKAGLSARLMTDMTKHIPAATQVMASRLVLKAALKTRVCNLFISNVPGPQTDMYMNGARILRNFGLAPLGDGMGLFIATPSHNGEMTFNVISCREIMPDIDYFVSCLDEEFAALKTAAEHFQAEDLPNSTPRRAVKKRAVAKKKPKPRKAAAPRGEATRKRTTKKATAVRKRRSRKAER